MGPRDGAAGVVVVLVAPELEPPLLVEELVVPPFEEVLLLLPLVELDPPLFVLVLDLVPPAELPPLADDFATLVPPTPEFAPPSSDDSKP